MNEAAISDRPTEDVSKSILDSINHPAAQELLVEGEYRKQLDDTYTLPVRDLCPTQGITAASGFREAVSAGLCASHTVLMTALSERDGYDVAYPFRRDLRAYTPT